VVLSATWDAFSPVPFWDCPTWVFLASEACFLSFQDTNQNTAFLCIKITTKMSWMDFKMANAMKTQKQASDAKKTQVGQTQKGTGEKASQVADRHTMGALDTQKKVSYAKSTVDTHQKGDPKMNKSSSTSAATQQPPEEQYTGQSGGEVEPEISQPQEDYNPEDTENR